MAEPSETTTAYGGRSGRVDEWSRYGWRKPWAWPDGRSINMRSTFRAKRLRPLVSALGGLDVYFRFAREQPEASSRVKVCTRNAEPENVWQSVQLQSRVLSGSISASKVMYPQ